jgi:hypothetical protein
MRKMQILMFALFAVCSIGVMVASVAFAAEELAAEFLWEGLPIAEGAELPFDTVNVGTTLLLLEDMKATGGAVDVLCSGLFGGVIMGPKDALITEVVGLPEPQLANIICTIDTKGACEGTEAVVEALNLPWLIEPLLTTASSTGFALDIVENTETLTGLPGYAVTCKTILGNVTDTCTGATGAIATNAATGIEGEFSETNETITPPGKCSLGGEKQGLLFGAGITTDTTGGVLSVSE